MDKYLADDNTLKKINKLLKSRLTIHRLKELPESLLREMIIDNNMIYRFKRYTINKKSEDIEVLGLDMSKTQFRQYLDNKINENIGIYNENRTLKGDNFLKLFNIVLDMFSKGMLKEDDELPY
jgi:hypothetical protein